MQVTLFGEDTALQQMIASIPDELDLRLERAGDYQVHINDPMAQLTDRQNEIVRTAIAAGYYDILRRTTQHDLATELGLSHRTIREHLQWAEAKIIQPVVIRN